MCTSCGLSRREALGDTGPGCSLSRLSAAVSKNKEAILLKIPSPALWAVSLYLEYVFIPLWAFYLFIKKYVSQGWLATQTWEDTVKTHNVRVVNTSLDTSVCVQTSRLMLSRVSVNQKERTGMTSLETSQPEILTIHITITGNHLDLLLYYMYLGRVKETCLVSCQKRTSVDAMGREKTRCNNNRENK